MASSSSTSRSSSTPRIKVKISFQDVGLLIGVYLPSIVANLKVAEDRLNELKEEDPVLAPLIDNLEEVYRIVTT